MSDALATRSLHLNTERTWRGGEKQTLYLVRGLLDRGHLAELVCPPGSPLESRAREQGVTVHPIPMRGELDLIAVTRIRRVLRGGDYDFVQMHTSHAHALGVLARGFGKRPITIVNRRVDFSILRRGLFGLNRIKYRHGVDRYIAISHAIRAVLIRDGVDGDRIAVVHSGVEPLPVPAVDRATLRAQLGVRDDHVLVGNVAHLAGHKGQIHLVTAMAQLRESHPQVRCVVIGDGDERAALEAEVAGRGLKSVVQLPGFQRDVSGYLGAFDLFVMPSIMEGLCTSLLDALMADLPVIGSDTGGIPEIIRDGETGLLVPPGDPTALAAAIARLVDDRDLARRLAAAGRQHVEAGFSVDHMVEGTIGVYCRLLAGDHRE